MEALRTHDIGEGGERHMESALTDTNEKTGMDVKEVYVGPSALWIANLLAASGQVPRRLVLERRRYATADEMTAWRFGRDPTATASTCAATPGAVLQSWRRTRWVGTQDGQSRAPTSPWPSRLTGSGG